jgi:opacity protein-like surface antigen
MTRPVLSALVAAAVALAPPAQADTSNFDLSGKIYTKYMYKNDDSQGCLSMSNPFWNDNIQGSNGACTEFELNIRAHLGSKVTAGVRLQSRWGMIWQDWWENGDLKPGGVQDTSGESLGMNHAAYLKLRGAFVRFAPPIPTVRWVTIGATDYSMWNEWTIGKARYIDRDNGNGVFVEGDALPRKQLSYTVGAMALPKLWAGPGWQTGLSYNDTKASLYGTDWAFAAKLESKPSEALQLRLIGSWAQDWEADRNSPSKTGSYDAARDADHSVGWVTRFRGINGTFDAQYSPPSLEWLTVSGLVGGSSNYVNPAYATNQVAEGQGFSPVVFKMDSTGRVIPSNDYAGKLLLELFDPLQVGLSAKFEYFNIGAEYNAIMGARREADVLLTEGIITGGFTRGGQLPTLNIANEFVDWDEPWYESCIGWNGGTGVLEWVRGPLKLSGEYTRIGYNTDKQGRDTALQYPDFLYTNGFTDTTAFTADHDYANKHDRGKDPRSVYARYQDRATWIGILNGQLALPSSWPLPRSTILSGKFKYVDDSDKRRLTNPDDDYHGRSWLWFGTVTFQPTDQLRTLLGYEYTEWKEKNRTGSEATGFSSGRTYRHTARAGLNYAFGGVLLSYTLEWFHKKLDRTPPAPYDMVWNVWRAKATCEVAF